MLDAVIGDGAAVHRARLLAALPTARARRPPYSPELNPAQRVFQDLRRRTEGRVYDAVADKQAVAKAYLAELAADPARVRRLCGWTWIRDALDALPTSAPLTAMPVRDAHQVPNCGSRTLARGGQHAGVFSELGEAWS